MTIEEIIIPRKISNQLLHLAQISPENEICGLIGGRHGVPVSCYPVQNVADRPERRFILDAKQQIEAMANMRKNGEELFAIFHSHPHSPAEPSPTDIELAAYPDTVYLIISLNTKGVLEMRGFRLNGQAVREIDLVLSND
ncbi:MAG: Mov34/MPN/PAD-1 family protein [Gammaproteobacteria bacterium]